MSDWQDIATAPKSGDWFQAWDQKHLWRDRPAVCIIRWDGKRFCDHLNFSYANVTHWMPLPEPPSVGMEALSEGRNEQKPISKTEEKA